jgi:hypothetical protein
MSKDTGSFPVSKWLAMVQTGAGLQEKQNCKNAEKAPAAAAAASPTASSSSLVESLERIISTQTDVIAKLEKRIARGYQCSVCTSFSQDAEFVSLAPCTHVLCKACSTKIAACVFCRTKIDSRAPVRLP